MTDLKGKHFALWGLAFKPNTDDMREATSRVVLAELFERGATVTAYDPVAMDEARRIFGDEPRLRYAENPMAALEGADALVIVTEWKEFRSPDFDRIKATLEDARSSLTVAIWMSPAWCRSRAWPTRASAAGLTLRRAAPSEPRRRVLRAAGSRNSSPALTRFTARLAADA